MGKQSFLRGAVILACANSVSRILGLVYIVALPRIIKDTGMGLLQMVKPIYYFGLVIAVAGLPVAISKMIAEKEARRDVTGVLRVFHAALAVMFAMGTLSTYLLYRFAPVICENVVRDLGAVVPLRAMAPTILLLAVAAAMRGLFQGMQSMTPSAVSQIVEQVVRVGGMVVLASLLMPMGAEYGAAGASLGSVIGALAGCIVLFLYYVPLRLELGKRSRKAVPREGYGVILKQLLVLSLPIVLGAILWPVMQMLDTAIVPARLQLAGYSATDVRELYGYYGMALSLMYFPNVITWALAVSLVPAISEAVALKTKRLAAYRAHEAIKITMLFGLPAGVGMYLLADQISFLLFGYVEAGPPLRILAIGSMSVGLYQTASGILQGLGRVEIPVRNLFLGVAVKLGLNYILTAMPDFGIQGAAWGTTLGFVVAATLNLISIIRLTEMHLDSSFVLKPAVACGVMGVAVPAVYKIGKAAAYPVAKSLFGSSGGFVNGAGVLAAVFIGIIVYGVMLLLIGGVTKRQIESFPKVGPRFARWLDAKGLLRV